MTDWKRWLKQGVALLCVGWTLSAWAGGELGVVLLHGKGGTPANLQALALKLTQAGHQVAVPEMPWSKFRLYNATVAEAQGEVDQAVAGLRQKGASAIVILGHSMGGNMAIAYAARRRGLAGVAALAPGHLVETTSVQQLVGDSVARARALVAEGKGKEPDEFDDINNGKVSTVITSAEHYLDYFDPQGAANMPATVAGLQAPLLWVVGTRDPVIFDRGRAYVFDRAPANAYNRYGVVEADHMGTPDAASDLVLDWLRGLPR